MKFISIYWIMALSACTGLLLSMACATSSIDPELSRQDVDLAILGSSIRVSGQPNPVMDPTGDEQPVTGNTLSLEEAVRAVLLENPSLKASFAEFESRLLKIPQVTSLPDPMFKYTQFIEEVQTRAGEQQFIVGLSQKFPWFGKLTLRGRIADAEAQTSLESYRTRVLDVIHEVNLTWHNLIYEHSAHAIKQAERAYIGQSLETASAAYAAGIKTRQAVLKAQTELSRVENELLGFPPRIDALNAALRRLMNRKEDSGPLHPIEVPLVLLELKETDLLSTAMSNRPELNEMDLKIGKTRQQLELAEKDYRPDFTIGAGYIGIADRPDGVSLSDEGEDAWNLSLAFNIPIPNARRRAQLAEAKKNREVAGQLKESISNNIRENIGSNLSRLHSLERQINIFNDSLLPLSQESFETSNAEYISGAGSFLDLLDAERTLLRTQLSCLAVIRDYRVVVSNLERATGSRIIH
jgi:cobalt-zinc-cadmium efflux system outer membrane protein